MKDFGQQIISEIIFSLILESEDDSFAVRVRMKVGQMILTLKEIVFKKGDIFHQDKKWLCRGIEMDLFVGVFFLQNMWKEIREMNEKR